MNVGDRVRVLDLGLKDEESVPGWADVWVEDMDATIGKVGKVVEKDIFGIYVRFPEDTDAFRWVYHESLLELVEEEACV
jgi:hypothetical protein